jgi:NAD-dependent deacetylase
MFRIGVLTGAGISRESGLRTFRDSDGLWAGYRIEDVCTPEALQENPKRVLDFYNLRRREIASSEPNAGHFALAQLENFAEVRIITQNIDDLHERAGSSSILHIHGEIFKARSLVNFEVRQEIRHDILLGDLGVDGVQLRPHICFFHETPYDWDIAMEICDWCDHFLVVGTSLNVYPAAGLVDIVRSKPVTLIDPNPPVTGVRDVICERASVGLPMYLDRYR